jgi:biotin transport system substrate-specific component
MDPASAHIPGRMTSASGRRISTHVGKLDRLFARGLAVLGFALLTWVGARLSVPLPGTPVPGTLQTLSVLLAGAFLGPWIGAASQAAYIFMGIAGLPVFALPGAGPLYLLGPTGGYLVGFVAAAFTVGALLEKIGRGPIVARAAAFVLGAAIIHAFGFAWLLVVLSDTTRALGAGVLPFVLFDCAKIVVATGVHAGYLRWKSSTRP